MCHLALDQLTWPGLFDLIANGHLAPGAKQSADVGIRSMKRNAAHGDLPAFCQRHIEQLGALLRVFEEHLVKIAQAEKQQGIFGQLALDAAILRHHGSELGVAGH